MPEPASLNAAPRVDAPPRIDAANDIFPYCLVWTPIPVLTWVFPFVGHLGMGNSQGVLFDFAGPFYINQHQLAFGKPTRFIQLEPRRGWDAAVEQANAKYAKLNHNLCFQNCHSHVATALDISQVGAFAHWNMIVLAMWMFFAGRFVSISGALYSLLPSVLIYAFVAVMWRSSA